MRGPFDFEHADPWSSDVVDVESLNAHVSDAILKRIGDARRAAPLGPTELYTSSLLALGPAGSGKTHLFVRVRRRSGPRAAFVLVRPEIGVEATPRHVLAQIVDSLGRPASGTADRQLDVIAGSMLAAVAGERVGPHVLLEQLRADESLREELIERVTAHLERLYPETWSDYLARLLRAPFLPAPDRRAANAWLAGREMTDVQASRLGGGASLGDPDVMPALRTLSIVAAHGSPIVLVFDQLENLVTADHQTQRIAAHGNLVSELYDTVRGLVIVQLALDAEWDRRIRPELAASHRSRVEARVLELALPTPDQREDLVRAWVGRLPPSTPWRFSAEQLARWRADLSMTPRQLMIACREALKGPGGDATEPALPVDDRLAELWSAQVEQSRAELERAAGEGCGTDAERLAAALHVLGELARLAPSSALEKNTRVVQLGGRQVRIVQHAHPNSVAASLRQAIAAAATGTFILREHELAFPPTWAKVDEHALALEATGARFIWLAREDAARLLALHDFLAAARSQDLEDAAGRPLAFDAVESWARIELDWRAWPAVSALISSDAPEPPREVSGAVRAVRAVPRRTGKPLLDSQTQAHALAVLKRLRVASVERIVREVRRIEPQTTAASVARDLARAGADVRWYGPRLCAFREGEP